MVVGLGTMNEHKYDFFHDTLAHVFSSSLDTDEQRSNTDEQHCDSDYGLLIGNTWSTQTLDDFVTFRVLLPGLGQHDFARPAVICPSVHLDHLLHDSAMRAATAITTSITISFADDVDGGGAAVHVQEPTVGGTPPRWGSQTGVTTGGAPPCRGSPSRAAITPTATTTTATTTTTTTIPTSIRTTISSITITITIIIIIITSTIIITTHHHHHHHHHP